MSVAPVPRLAVLVMAAGSGTRLDAGSPKAFVGIDDRSILQHALDGVRAGTTNAQIVVVVPPGREGTVQAIVSETPGATAELTSAVAGGVSRQKSVAAGLAAVWPDVDHVLVHDAARALTPASVFERVTTALDAGLSAVIPVLPVIDTLKRVEGGTVSAAVDREELRAAQTPQGFRRDVLETAYRVADREYTDDAALVAAAGHPIEVVDGDALAFKITTAHDLERARSLLEGAPARHSPPRKASGPRVGVGSDVHAFGGDGILRLAGLPWPGEPALAGHSDGDAVAHAIVDALLAAAGLGDIGSVFGIDDPAVAGAHADIFLGRTLGLLTEAGWAIGNVSVQLQANRPRFAGRRAEAEQALSAALGGAAVSVSATTTDGLGFTGRGEGIAATAIALLVPSDAAG